MNRMKKFSMLFIVLSLVLVQSLGAQNGKPYAGELEAYERFVEQQMDFDRIPGVSVAFLKDDFTWARGFGYADLENHSPAKPESAYRLASVTKTMTAVAVLQLAEAGKLDLDAEVQTYVPYFPKKLWPVRVDPLLGHLGGISHYRNYALEGHFKDHKDTREAIAVFEDFDLVAEPGERYRYSSYGYNLLGAVIEGASGQSYGEYMSEHIWQPLGMDATRLDDPDDLIANRVRGYRIIDGEIKNSEFVNISSRFAAGGTRSTVLDLLNFAEGLMMGKLLSRESMDLMWTSMAQSDGLNTGYGRGWSIGSLNGRFVVLHGGAQAETRTRFVIFPDDRFAVAVACNLEGTNLSPYVNRLAEAILDTPGEIKAYTGVQSDDIIYQGMKTVFDDGLSHFLHHRIPLTSEPDELDRAFSYFTKNVNRRALEADFDAASQKIREGRHPVAGQAFVKVGSFMAAKLAKRYGPERIVEYHTSGPILYFADYIDMYTTNSDISPAQRFGSDFESLVQTWQRDWQQTWTETTRSLSIDPSTNFGQVADELKKIFAGSKIYPDFVDEFASAMRQLYVQGDGARGHQAARVAYELYPKSPDTNADYGISLLAAGEPEQAKELISRSAGMNPNGPAGANGLNRVAYQMASIGMPEQGMSLLKIAVELHPNVANLYDSIGEFYLNKGDIEESISYYKKAIEIDPDFENAKRMLQKIEAEYMGEK